MSKPTSAQRAYFAWLQPQGCIKCGGDAIIHHITHKFCHEGIEVRITKDHWRVVPLCLRHHVDSKEGIHGIGSQWGFFNMHGINLPEMAAKLLAQYKDI